jgi:hypothetical protein
MSIGEPFVWPHFQKYKTHHSQKKACFMQSQRAKYLNSKAVEIGKNAPFLTRKRFYLVNGTKNKLETQE